MAFANSANIGLAVHCILVAIAFLLVLGTIPPVRETITDLVMLM